LTIEFLLAVCGVAFTPPLALNRDVSVSEVAPRERHASRGIDGGCELFELCAECGGEGGDAQEKLHVAMWCGALVVRESLSDA